MSNNNVCRMESWNVVVISRKDNKIIGQGVYIAINEAAAIIKAHGAWGELARGKYPVYFTSHIGSYETAIGKVSTKAASTAVRS
jgi:hypothetical protein